MTFITAIGMPAAAMLDPMKGPGPKTLAVVVMFVALAGCAGSATPPPTVSPTAAATPTATPAPSATPTATPAATSGLQAMLDEKRASYGAPGALAVLRIASITKPIVAALVLDAVDRGEVSLDDVVDDLLPGVVRDEPPITVRMLLDHTSGVFDEGNDGNPVTDIEKLSDPALQAEARSVLERYSAGERVIGPDRVIVALAETHDRYFEPGGGYHYSNVNYQLAAMVLEKTTGRPLADLLASRIVEPLGLVHTTIAPPDTASPELRGYVTSASDGSLVDITDDLVFFGNGGNGGIVATADDLLEIMQAIVSGRLLPAALVADMKEPNRESYGLGLATYTLSCGTFYGHGGLVNGTGSIALVSPDGDAGVVIALNLSSDRDSGLPALADRMLCSKG